LQAVKEEKNNMKAAMKRKLILPSTLNRRGDEVL
jgi:hypothetical protein